MSPLILTFIGLLLPATVMGLETTETTFEYTRRIYQELETIKSLTPEEYLHKVDTFRLSIEKYIDHKKLVCKGEFSTVVLNPSGQGGKTKNSKSASAASNKLSKQERQLCFREMKALQITFINHMFLARERYLDYLHKIRIKELGIARQKSINSVQTSFAGKKRSR